jgi:hypothetical protein
VDNFARGIVFLPGKFDSSLACCRTRLILRVGEKHFTDTTEIAVRNEVNKNDQQIGLIGFWEGPAGVKFFVDRGRAPTSLLAL